nr:LysR substrate-binding domain-containing protein [Cyanobium sp. FACHB-13342]
MTLECLASLDLSLWLRSGQAAGQRLGLNQSSVSRKCNQALELFGLELVKQDQEWSLQGDAALLQLERRVHQLARWQDLAPLRLEATYWSGPLLATPAPAGWLLGTCDIVGVGLPMALLRQRVIDGWIAAGPDWPDPDDPELVALPLCRYPVHLVVGPNHPLLNQGPISWDDVAAFPSLALPPGTYPKVEACLKHLGLWNAPVRMRRYRRERWEGQTEADLTIGYATVLSERVAGSLVRLPLDLPLTSGESLVVRREFGPHPHTLALAAELHRRLEAFAAAAPELTLLPLPPAP